VLKLKVLVIELHTINTLTSSAITGREISTLNHELLDDTMESGTFV